MGKFSRDKGARGEREIVARHLALGVHAERVPLSGACGGGFRTIEKWLAGNAALFLRRDRQSPLVVLPWETWARLVKCKT